MPKITRRVLGAGVASLLLAGSVAVALGQAMGPAPVRVRGTIEKVDGSTLTVKSRTGKTVTIKLAANARVTAMVKAALADIKVGSFIGVTAMPQPDGSQKAIGINIFMDAQRGVVPARFSPWDREPGSTMTNADVTTKVAGVNGDVLTVKYKDGEKNVVVPPDTPIVTFAPATKADLKPGAGLITSATKNADGKLATSSVTVGTHGVNPPM